MVKGVCFSGGHGLRNRYDRFDTLLYRLPQPWIYYLQGVSFDLMHSIGNVVFFLVFCQSSNVLQSFRRKNEK